MQIEIRTYNAKKDYSPLLNLIKSEGGEWEDHLKPEYQIALKNSISYVALVNDQLCGYSRSIDDSGLYILIMDLLVHKKFRGHAIGKQLMECVLKDFPNCDVYVLSDVDGYYQKLCYEKEGSVFKVKIS